MKYIYIIAIVCASGLLLLTAKPQSILNLPPSSRRATAEPKQTFIVELHIKDKQYLFEVESKDSTNAVIDAVWPVTVWTKKDWDELASKHFLDGIKPEKLPTR